MAKVSKCNVTSTETYQGYIGYKREAFNIFTLAVFTQTRLSSYAQRNITCTN